MNFSVFANKSIIMWWWFMLITTLIINSILSNPYVNSEFIGSSTLGVQDDLQEMLNTEKVLIDTLRHYIDTNEQKLNFLKRKTLEIQNIHDGAATNREKYLYNPINAVTILKRFTADWKGLKSYAEQYLNTEELTKNYTQQLEYLTFPTDDDYDNALIHLLRIQDMYKLEPQGLSVGEVNGVKLGSQMSWSDCLEIGIKSSKNGYQTYAKYWMETALEKLPNVEAATTGNRNSPHISTEGVTPLLVPSTTDVYTHRARLQIMKALLKTEYQMGNLKKALKIANEMLQIQPQQKNVIKAKQQIENDLKKNNGNNSNSDDAKQLMQIKKSDEELMIEEICRDAATTQINKQTHTASLSPSPTVPYCSIVTNNVPLMLLQPLHVELLSLDPYIVIYHNAIRDTQVNDLKDLFVEQDDIMEFTKLGQKKMRQINGILQHVIGHHGEGLYDDWQVGRYNFENFMELQTSSSAISDIASQAKILFNLQQPLIGGSVIFPQLELSINLPLGSLLYWSTLNEFGSEDYRSKYHICPVIGGTQMTACTTIKKL